MLRQVRTTARNGARTYFTLTEHRLHVPFPNWMKYSLMGVYSVGFAWIFSIFYYRPGRSLVSPDQEFIDKRWIQFWLQKREEYRLEKDCQNTIINDEPEVAAEKLLTLSRKKAYLELIEDLKVLEGSLTPEQRAFVNSVPSWAK
eukprot:TRINITY_DN9074_c0_g1_i2.p1 TRINITY_DN9074_c0_g1~~TRINITY_DN9074_c0_g1_i2.p1  ORF type:complete len:144 (-),score=26.20 TRINITY_DN9074_c0_g1_i2:61-492(-)